MGRPSSALLAIVAAAAVGGSTLSACDSGQQAAPPALGTGSTEAFNDTDVAFAEQEPQIRTMQSWLRTWGRPMPTTTPGILPQIPSRAPAPHMSSIPPQPDTSQMSGMHGTQFDRTFRQAQPVGSTDVPAVTAAFERGLQQLAQDVVGWTLVSGQADATAAKR